MLVVIVSGDLCEGSLFLFFRNVFSLISVIFGNKLLVLVWLVVNESQGTAVAILWLCGVS